MSSRIDDTKQPIENPGRKRYEAPRVEDSARFETLAAGCGSILSGPADGGACGFSSQFS